MTPTNLQVSDDVELLELMLADSSSAPELYRPTNYWTGYVQKLVAELRTIGLRDFRRRHDSILNTFGGNDLRPVPQMKRWYLDWLPQATRQRIASTYCRSSHYAAKRDRALAGYVNSAASYGESRLAAPLARFTGSLVGNPEEYVETNGNIYTLLHINYYIQYAYCTSFVPFGQVACIAELGSGAGKQAEVIKRLHSDMSFLLFDIPPQLYVCEQYLKAIFPNDVVSYRETREMKEPFQPRAGAIYIFGARNFPLLSQLKVDLFWNSSSLQEMEPSVAVNYLSTVRQSARYVYLREKMDGKELAKKWSEGGVLQQTKLNHYANALEGYQMVDYSQAYMLDFADVYYASYYDCIWAR